MPLRIRTGVALGAAATALLSLAGACGAFRSPNASALALLEPYEITCVLAYIGRTMGRSPEAVTENMKAYVLSAPYDALADARGRELLEAAFAATRTSLAAAKPMDQGWALGRAFASIGRACTYYRFEECSDSAQEGPEQIGAMLGAINKLAERGKLQWDEWQGTAAAPGRAAK